ncbi:hypothetical protein DPEC_G00350670 [Dallia pectoralis]|uniref:Uncharacterized protein n=1 Tax=Dallia pectoralis TaxID=75939 RepID=A0ACC2F1S9_DALPE|nr:hypothetical protein DPEC_G00350670 [Dallia pectoralis]
MDLWPGIVLLLLGSGCPATDGRKPYFLSRNFNTVLHWSKVDSHGKDVWYSVQYTRYGEKFKPKLECLNITALWCDLTTETPYVYSQSYRARVYGNGQLLGQTVNFKPLRETVLGPAVLRVTPKTSSIHVTVTLPLGPDNRTSIEEIFKISSFVNHTPPTLYTLNVTHPRGAAQVHENTDGEFVIDNLRNDNTEYCGYVSYKPTKDLFRPASENQEFCVRLPGERPLLFPWFILLACLLLCCLLLALVLCCRYVRKPKNLPEALKLRKSTSPAPWHSPETTPIAMPDLTGYDVQKADKPKGSTSYFRKGQSCDSYHSQWAPPSDHYNNSAESSTNYSMIVVQVNKEEEEEEVRQEREVDIDPPWSADTIVRSDCGGESDPGGFLRGVRPEPDRCLRDRDVRPVVLPTLRHPNGGLLLRPESRTAISSSVDAEAQPLLSDPCGTQPGPPRLSNIVTVDQSEWLNSDALKVEATTYRPNFHADCEDLLITPSCNHWTDRKGPPQLLPQDSFGTSTYAPQQTLFNHQQQWDKEEREKEREEEGPREFTPCFKDKHFGLEFTMATETLVQEKKSHQMSNAMALTSQIKKKTFNSSDEEASYAEFYPIISGDLMSVKELLNIGNFPRSKTWEDLTDAMAGDEQLMRGQKWTLFGNEAEKVEIAVLREQRRIRQWCDRVALRRQAEQRASVHLNYLEDVRKKAPDFSIPLRAHTVWDGMGVTLSCTPVGCPPPLVTWYKNGVPLSAYGQAWNYRLKQTFGIDSLEIRRCCAGDAGEYKAVAKSSLGEATTVATLVVNSYQGTEARVDRSQTAALKQEALFESGFPPSWVTEGNILSLQCSFTSALLPSQQDVAWFRDGVQLTQSSRVDVQTAISSTSLTLSDVHKEDEGVYRVRLRTSDGIQEHNAYVYVKDASAVVSGGPGSPLALEVSDIQKDYVFLTWEPPSADGHHHVEGYYVERCDISSGQWLLCNDTIQKACHYPVRGLSENTIHQFRVCAVNQAGVGRPSRVTRPITTIDPLEHTRAMVVKVNGGREITITKDQLESQMKVPLPPTGVCVCQLNDSYAVLSWTEPEPRGKEQLTFYVEQSIAGKNSWRLASMDLVVGSPRFPVFDLQTGKSYSFRVRSVNKYGVSDPSEASPPVSLGPPQAAPPPATSVQAFRDTDSAVLLKWEEPKEKEGSLGYYLYYSEAGKQDWKTVNNKPTANTQFTVHGLKTKKEYVFRVRSVGRAGKSVYSNESSPVLVKAALAVPSPPSAIALLLCTSSEMILTWRGPAHNGGDPVRGYYLEQKDTELEAWRMVTAKPAERRQYKVCNLTGGHYYEFRVFAANIVGVGKPSEASQAFVCEPWTTSEPGCPYDLEIREVRNNSLVLLWARPLYEGKQGPITGYQVELSEGDQSQSWAAVNKKPVTDTVFKVSGLQPGLTYRFRVRAINKVGIGIPSLPSEPITAQNPTGTGEIETGVDNDGHIFLAFRTAETAENDDFVWRKNYRDAIDAGRAWLRCENDRSILTLTNPSEEDLGLYTVEMTDKPHISSSFDFTSEDLERLNKLSWQVCHPLIALRSKWQAEVSEKGNVRLWIQTESLTDAAELRLILNDREISSTAAHKINFDRTSGLIEILFERLSKEDEGSYTAQLRDGRAKNQFTLVFVGEKFRQILAQSEAKRHDCKRKLGPYFMEYLSWVVTEDCVFMVKCKVTNVNKDTTLKWFKDGVETSALYDQQTGVSTMTVLQVTKKEAGHYKAVVSDGRGEDVSTLELLGEEYDKLLRCLSKQCALSAGPLMIQSTSEGFRLFCCLKYYISYMRTSWCFKESRIDQLDRCKQGSSMQKVWMEILGPTENDKGKYTLEMFDGQEKHTRSMDLSGQALADILLEYQRLKQVAFADKNRARVTKGLPDVVAIMENKSLCLKCFTDGDPAPEMSWLRNDRSIVSGSQYIVANETKSSTLTLINVTSEDSGHYSIFVSNKYGTDTVSVTVSVYKRGEKPPAHAVEM